MNQILSQFTQKPVLLSLILIFWHLIVCMVCNTCLFFELYLISFFISIPILKLAD